MGSFLHRSHFTCSPCHCALLAVGVLIGANFDASGVCAAPVTLRFEATVGQPRQGVVDTVPPSWNISLQQGDTISGTFTFEPFDAPSNTNTTTLAQPFDFSIDIKGRVLTTSQYGVEAFNDAVSDDVPQRRDIINSGCSFAGGPAVCQPSAISPGSPIEWAFAMAMHGNSSVLVGADIPADVTAWQAFDFYDMGVSFMDSNTRRFYGFLATPRSFQEVPEPDSCSYVVVCALFIVLAMQFRNWSKLLPTLR